LRVAAASDLQGVLPTLTDRFTANSGITVTPIIGASGQLAQQIRQGAPFDVFLSANMTFVQDLAKEGRIEPDTVRLYATGRLVLVVSRSSHVAVDGLAALARPEVKRVAIANPELAPYGYAARQALEKAGLLESLKPKLVQADTVRQALQYVQTGNAEAGLVAHSVARVPEVDAIEIDPVLYEPIVQGLGVVAQTGHGEAARTFTRFLLSGEGQKVLASAGFGSPPDAAR
jgi:molybdate transport system substrate-binding protein